MGRKAKYRKYLILILLLACFILALYIVCNTKNSLTFLCRNEDILFPDNEIEEMTEEQFANLSGFELRFGKNDQSFLVGYNRFNKCLPMYGWLEYCGKTLL